MAPRSTARSSAARHQASSPPKVSRQSQSPVGRRTRSRRSRSVDSEAVDVPPNKRQTGRLGDREMSVSSAGSASSRGSRARKHARKPAMNRDLSMVAEDAEDTGEARGFATSEEEEEEDEVENIEILHPDSGSPAMSQMSGTTAWSSHSAREIAKLDPMMAEILPELLESASKILDVLAPKNRIETDEQVGTILKELKIPGSRRAKHLHLHEQRFMVARGYYGSDIYIRPSFVLRKLLGTDSPEEGNFRPDPVIHAANLATLVKEFLVLQKGEAKTRSTLQGVCNIFPEPFTSERDEMHAGEIVLVDEIFDLALEFYTQSAMVCLERMEEDGDQLTPNQILASIFYDQYDQSGKEASFAEITDGGVLKNILRSGQPNSQIQVEKIQERLGLISATFRQSDEAREAGDLVDTELLDEMFPWLGFITNLVQWSRNRFAEVSETIDKQGGIDEVTESLVELIKSNDSQVEIRYELPPAIAKKRELLPAADINQSNQSSLSLSTGSIQALLKAKRGKVGNSSSNQEPTISLTSSTRPQARSKQASSAPVPVPTQRDPDPAQEVDDDYQPIMDDGNDDLEERPRPIAEYLTAWNENSKEKNKENHKPITKPAVKQRLIDPQPGARKVVWDESQDNVGYPSPAKRTWAQSEHSDESEDQGFQDDQRQIDPDRRAVAPPGPRLTPVRDSSPPHKRQRTNQREVSPRVESSRTGAQRRPERAEFERAVSEVLEEEEEDSEEEEEEGTPPPTATQISTAARYATARAKGVQVPKGRTRWSDRDSDRLKRRIEKHGCAWSLIFQMGQWEVTRDQVALKDRARNMKVNMLKTGLPLPLNFENVPLGKKEIASVRTRIPDYEE